MEANRQKDEGARRGGSGACDLYPRSWLPNAVSAGSTTTLERPNACNSGIRNGLRNAQCRTGDLPVVHVLHSLRLYCLQHLAFFCAFPLDTSCLSGPASAKRFDVAAQPLRMARARRCSRASPNMAWADAMCCSAELVRCHRTLLSGRNVLVGTSLLLMLE